MRSPTTWLGLIAMVASAALLIARIVRYVFARLGVQRREGKSGSEALLDGAKPATGSLWSDALVFASLFVGAFGALLYLALA